MNPGKLILAPFLKLMRAHLAFVLMNYAQQCEMAERHGGRNFTWIILYRIAGNELIQHELQGDFLLSG
ncbi:hypothetical protein D3C81_1802140 [compost metagenome]